jgi:hypothetical protein
MGIREDTGNTLNAACLKHLNGLKVAGVKVVAWRSNNLPVYSREKGCYIRFYGRKGVSDILGTYPQEAKLWDGRSYVFGVTLAVETKARGDRLSADQKAFGDDVREAGGIYIVVRKISDLLDALAALERENACLRGG